MPITLHDVFAGNGEDRTGDSNKDMFTQLDRIEAKLDQLLTKKKRVVKPKSANTSAYPYWFDDIWKAYPKVSGANKAKTFKICCQRLKESGDMYDDKPDARYETMLEGAIRYAKFIGATGQYTKLPQTFFGPDKHYLCDWTIPKPKNGQPEVYDQSHSIEGNSRDVSELDPIDPYAELKDMT